MKNFYGYCGPQFPVLILIAACIGRKKFLRQARSFKETYAREAFFRRGSCMHRKGEKLRFLQLFSFFLTGKTPALSAIFSIRRKP